MAALVGQRGNKPYWLCRHHLDHGDGQDLIDWLTAVLVSFSLVWSYPCAPCEPVKLLWDSELFIQLVYSLSVDSPWWALTCLAGFPSLLNFMAREMRLREVMSLRSNAALAASLGAGSLLPRGL